MTNRIPTDMIEDRSSGQKLNEQLAENVTKITDIELNVKDFIQASDNGDLSLATQRAIDSIGNAVTNGVKILLPRGQWDWKNPVLIHQKDGLTVRGAGRWATKLIAKSPLQFVDTLGLPDNYNTNAFFVVTKRRVTGGVNGALNPNGADANAWFLNFEGISFHGQYNDGTTDYSKTINGIFTNGMAHCTFKNMYGEYLKYGVDFGAGGVYRVTVQDIDWSHCVNGFKNVKGTTFNASSVGYQQTDEGWELNQAHYSTLTCCAIDYWGSGKYAYTLEGIGITLNGCGMENGYGGALNIKGRTAVVFNGFNHAGGAIPTALNYTGQNKIADFGVADFSVLDTNVSVVFNNCTFRQEYSTDGTTNNILNFPIRVKAGAKAVVNLTGENLGAPASIFSADLDGEIIVNGYVNKFAGSYYISADTVATDNANYVIPLTSNYYDGFVPTVNSELTIKSTGLYKIDMNLVLTGTSLNYIYILGTSLGSKVVEDNISTLATGKNRFTYSVILKLRATEKLSFLLRTNTGGGVTLKKGSIITVTQL